MNLFPGPFTSLAFFNSGFFITIFALLTIVIHLSFAFGVYHDGERLGLNRSVTTGVNRDGEAIPVVANYATAFVKPLIWAIAIALGGLPVVGLYWLIHHSSLTNFGR